LYLINCVLSRQQGINTDGNFIAETSNDIAGANAYHVVTLDGTTTPIFSDTRLDGFTITAGQATSSYPAERGGGLFCNGTGGECSPTLANMIFSGNSAEYGGAVMNHGDNSGVSSPAFTNVIFRGNLAVQGGAIFNNGNSGVSSPSLTNVTFYGNTATATPIPVGAALYNWGTGGSSAPVLTNVIVWGNTGTGIMDADAASVISYSDIQDGYAGMGNIAADPLFVDAANGNLRLQFGSPAIDTGDNANCSAADLDGLSRPFDGNGDSSATCDLGAYEYQLSGTIYVKADATGPVTGISWTHAFPNLQDALAMANPGDEIWVAAGVYYPDVGRGQTNDDENSTFYIRNGVSLYGGFAATETQRTERNWTANLTVLSGDIDQETLPDTSLTGVVTTTDHINGSNAYHVVTSLGEASTANLDGFTITAGDAMGTPGNVGTSTPCGPACGGGMYTNYSNPRLTNLTFTGNRASSSGGGMYSRNSSHPLLTNVTFTGNTANGTELYDGGGGMHIDWNSNPTLTEVTFTGNQATGSDGGGGLCNNYHSNPTLTDVTFTNNTSQNGGGMYNRYFSHPALTNVTFMGNSANKGGGLYSSWSSNPVLINVNFTGNYAVTGDGDGGGMYNNYLSYPTLKNVTFSGNEAINGGGMYNTNSNATLDNVTFTRNFAWDHGGGINNYNSSPAIYHSTFNGNRAVDYGGGMYNNYYNFHDNNKSPLLENVIFSGNVATLGGGMYNYDNVHPTLKNVTISGNTATNGAGIGGMYNTTTSNPTLINTIVWGNSNGQIWNYSNSSPTVYRSDIMGCGSSGAATWDPACGIDGGGNIDADPQFRRPPSPGPDLGWNTVDDDYGDLHLGVGSPAINAGMNTYCPTTDMDGNTRPFGPYCEMGVYESVFSPVFVDDSASGTATGVSWTNAFTNFQDALTNIISGTEIWVAAGVYYPDEGVGQIPNAITSTFIITDGITLYGGFVATETLRTQRDWTANTTILSGDIDHETLPDTTLSGIVTTTAHITGTNATHVVTSYGVTTTATLDGFTITAGQANGSGLAPSHTRYGGGLYNHTGSPTLANLTFSGNLAVEYGGGMYNYESSPSLTDTDFTGNSAYGGGGMFNDWYSSPTLTDITFLDNTAAAFDGRGGGMYNISGSSPTLVSVTFTNNSAASGGGMYNIHIDTKPTLTDVTFTGNSATGVDFISGNGGGGLYNNGSSPTLADVTFTNNTAASSGGGMADIGNSDPTLTDVIFLGNTALYGGGVYHDGSDAMVSGADSVSPSALFDVPTFINVTFSGNTALFGGGLCNMLSNAMLTNVVFVGNAATDSGGGMFNYSYGDGGQPQAMGVSENSPTLTNVTFANNSAGSGGGIANIHFSSSEPTALSQRSPSITTLSSSPQLINVILWGNTATNTLTSQISNTLGSTPVISFTLIQSATASGSWDASLGIDGGNNLDADPLFVRNPDPGPDGIWGTADDDYGDLRLQPTSPAINSGINTSCPTTDLDGISRPIAVICDMGAYESTFGFRVYIPLMIKMP
jgi:hypothetical protein